jgi:hypothetical protein
MDTITSRTARWTLLAALLLALGTMPAQAQLGIAGGLNFESTDDIRAGTEGQEAAFDNSTGYHIGVVYDLGLGPLSIRPGFFYRRVGTYDFQAIASDLQDPTFDVEAFEIPVDARLTVLSLPVLKPYLLAGPQVTIVQGEEELGDLTKGQSFSLNVGAGTEISLPGAPITLQPELRYEFGATKYLDEDESITIGGPEGPEFSPADSPRFSAFSVRLHILF